MKLNSLLKSTLTIKATVPVMFLFLLLLSFKLRAEEPYTNEVKADNIETVIFQQENQPQSIPAIRLHSNDRLELRFDVLGESFDSYEYRIVHCDFDWNESDLLRTEYMDGRPKGYIDDRQNSFNTHVKYEHYHLTLPNRDFEPKRSGNYALVVFRNNDPDDVVLVRRFFVYERGMSFTAEVKAPDHGRERRTHHELEVKVNLEGTNLPDPKRNLTLMFRQNGRWDNAIKDPEPRRFTGDQMIFDYGQDNTFPAGNQFRQFDLRSIQSTGRNVRSFSLDSLRIAQLYPDEVRGTQSFTSYSDFNGFRMIKKRGSDQSHVEGDYAMVSFFLDQATPMEEEIYLFGELTDWQMQNRYRLTYNAEREGYTGNFLFKQGFYNYYYVTPSPNFGADASYFEGDHRQTINDYSVYIYQKAPGDRTHRLKGFRSLSSD